MQAAPTIVTPAKAESMPGINDKQGNLQHQRITLPLGESSSASRPRFDASLRIDVNVNGT